MHFVCAHQDSTEAIARCDYRGEREVFELYIIAVNVTFRFIMLSRSIFRALCAARFPQCKCYAFRISKKIFSVFRNTLLLMAFLYIVVYWYEHKSIENSIIVSYSCFLRLSLLNVCVCNDDVERQAHLYEKAPQILPHFRATVAGAIQICAWFVVFMWLLH